MAPVRLALALAALAASARAEAPRVRIEAASDCPTAAQLGAAFAALPELRLGPGGFAASVERSGGASRLTLAAPDGSPSLARAIASDDCAAIADAFALIVRGRFEELRVLSARRRGHRPGLLTLALTGGAALYAGPLAATGGGQIAVGLRVLDRRVALLLRLSAALDAPYAQGAVDRVDLVPAFVRLGLAVRFERGRLWLQPGLSAGVALLTVTAPGADGAPSQIRPLAALSAELLGAVRLWQRVSACLELQLIGLPSGERYVVRPDGVQALSPYLRAAVQVGLQVDL